MTREEEIQEEARKRYPKDIEGWLFVTTTSTKKALWMPKESTIEGAWEKKIIEASADFGKAVGEKLGKLMNSYIERYQECITKASRLAESILMDWDKEQQVELAKEVASIVNQLLPEEE